MKKLLFILFLAGIGYTQALAQSSMTDDQVAAYIKTETASGASQKQIASDLVAKGVTQEQLMRIKAKYENAGSSSNVVTTVADVARDRVNNGQLVPSTGTAEAPVEPGKKIFGHDIFNNPNLSFEASMNVATPTDYRLGPGDELILDIYGASQFNSKFKVAPDGTITIPNEGPVAVAGLTITQAQTKVKNKVGGHYQGSSIKLTVGQTRTIIVNVMGEVKSPGTYTVSAFSTVFNALYLAGGIKQLGTLRDIKVSRNGKIITTVDVYNYLLNGHLAGNITLRDNDVIIVGPYENLVHAEGNIKRPMYYELKKGETLQTLLKYTGGFTSDAYQQNIRVERTSADGLTVHNIGQAEFGKFVLQDGDVAVVGNVIERMQKTAIVKGAVFRPGAYCLNDTINSVKTLIKQAGGLLEDAFTARAVLHRMKADRTWQTMTIDLADIMKEVAPDVVMQNEDELIISSTRDLNNSKKLVITGDVFNPGTYTYSEGETLEDLITEAGGLRESASLANVEIARRIYSDKDTTMNVNTAKIYSFTLQEGLVIKGETGFKLQPHDVVNIRRNPNYAELANVHIAGEVNYRGTYIMTNKEERLSSIIKRAGGLTVTAYADGAQLMRKVSKKDYELQRKKLEVAYTAADSAQIMSEMYQKIYTIGIDLKKAMEKPGSTYDVVLQEGDSIYIPKLNNTVKISGEVLFPNTVSYIQKKSVSYYLNQAGGVGQNAKKKYAYIVYPNGQVSKASKGHIQPGCEIMVPSKAEKKVDTTKSTLYLAITTTIATIASVLITALK